jgi:hypothetical protein
MHGALKYMVYLNDGRSFYAFWKDAFEYFLKVQKGKKSEKKVKLPEYDSEVRGWIVKERMDE